jgi:ankyrin repeat protein
MTCQRCHTARYCQKGCQTADWKRKDGRSHREVCVDLRDYRKVEDDAEKFLDACYDGNLSNIKSLVNSGVDPNHTCQDHYSPMYGVCGVVGMPECERAAIILALLSIGADPNSEVSGETALQLACHNGYVDAARLLIVGNADVCAADDDGVTALHIACRKGNLDLVVVLFGARMSNLEVDKQGKTGLDYARDAGHDPIVKFITEKIKERQELKDEENAKNLLVACYAGNLSNVKSLLESGVDPNHACQDDEPPLFGMCEGGSADVVSVLLDNGADPNLVDACGQTALHIACRQGYLDIAVALILSNADLSAADDNGMTALHVACCNGPVTALVQVLLDHKLDLARMDKQGKTALDYAREAGHVDILKLLKAAMDKKEFEEDVGQELLKSLDVEGTAPRSEIGNAEGSKVTVAAQVSSGMAPADRVEQLELEVNALNERLRHGRSQFWELTRAMRTTVREKHHQEMENVQRQCEDLRVALVGSQEQMSALKDSLSEQEAILQRGFQEKLKGVTQLQQLSQKKEADKAQQHLQKSLKEQKQKLEQRLNRTRTEAAGASETAQKLHLKELTELRTDLRRQQEQAATERCDQGKAAQTINELRKELQAAHTLEAELSAASSLAAVSAAEQLPGLDDSELRGLEAAVRNEYTRRQQLTLERERTEMRRTMRVELERERAIEREEREEAAQCPICLDRDKDTALNCGHQACASCAIELANCHFCRLPITTRTRLY